MTTLSRLLIGTVLAVGLSTVVAPAFILPFTLKHQNTSIVLVSGTGVGPFSGPVGAVSVAAELARLLKPYRSQPDPKARNN